jgi:hypothetical protein
MSLLHDPISKGPQPDIFSFIPVTPSGYEHRCALQPAEDLISTWDVAGVLGTSEGVIRKTYGHHSVEHLRRAVGVWSKRPSIRAKASGLRAGICRSNQIVGRFVETTLPPHADIHNGPEHNAPTKGRIH